MKRFTEREYEELIGAQHEVCPAQQAAEERSTVVIPSAAKDLALRIFLKMRRARFFAQFILSGQGEILRCAQDDVALRMTWLSG